MGAQKYIEARWRILFRTSKSEPGTRSLGWGSAYEIRLDLPLPHPFEAWRHLSMLEFVRIDMELDDSTYSHADPYLNKRKASTADASDLTQAICGLWVDYDTNPGASASSTSKFFKFYQSQRSPSNSSNVPPNPAMIHPSSIPNNRSRSSRRRRNLKSRNLPLPSGTSQLLPIPTHQLI